MAPLNHFRFADSHEYAFLDEALVRIGISEFGDQLGYSFC